MDLRNWSIDHLLQLPDEAFGRRWPIAVAATVEASGTEWVISNDGLPEACVVWAVWVVSRGTTWSPAGAVIRLGDQIPVAAADFDVLDALLPTMAGVLAARGSMYNAAMGMGAMIPMRVYVPSAGRRLVVEIFNASSAAAIIQVGIVVSSVPTEVPDCLLSE